MGNVQVSVVTTCNKAGFDQYGHHMLRTFQQYWEKDITLYFYNEDTPEIPKPSNVIYRDFPEWFIDWKNKHKDNRGAHGRDPKYNRKTREYDFRFDCVKFSHKIAAVTDIGLELTSGLLIWIDADTRTHKHVDSEWLCGLAKPESYMSWLGRTRLYPECGFMVFNCSNPAHLKFMHLLRDTYEGGEVFKFEQTHDSFVIHQLVLRAVREGWMSPPHNIAADHAGRHHVFVYSELGSRLDHAKGARKVHGRTLAAELKGGRREEYWKP